MIKRVFLIAAAIAVTGVGLSAQEGVFDKCYLEGGNAESLDVYMTEPAGFHEVDDDNLALLVINKDYKPADALIESGRVAALHPVTLEADNKECVLLYPMVSATIPWLTHTPERELRAAAGDGKKDVSGSVRKIELDDMSQYCNADVAYVYEMKLPEPYMGKYSNSIGVCLRKYAHPALLMRVVMTDEGMKNKDEYLRALLGSVRYGDAVSEEGVKMERAAREDSLRIAKHGFCRHIQEAMERNAESRAQ